MTTKKDDKMSTEKIDVAIEANETVGDLSPAAIQAKFGTLRDLEETEMEVLNKKLLRRIDWRLMPTITIMFLMNYLDRINVSNGMSPQLTVSRTSLISP